LIKLTRPTFRGTDIATGPDFRTRSDRNLSLLAPAGLLASLFAVGLAGSSVGRRLSGLSLVLFALLVGAVIISTSQATMVRLQPSRLARGSTAAFVGVLKAWVGSAAALVLSVVLALLVVLP